jgi:hypothetical protein
MPARPGGQWTAAQRALWRELWAAPQAVQWDDSASTLLALYVAHVSAVLAGTAAAWQAAEARQLADRMGLTPSGMASLGWRIADPGETADVVPLRGVS